MNRYEEIYHELRSWNEELDESIDRGIDILVSLDYAEDSEAFGYECELTEVKERIGVIEERIGELEAELAELLAA